MILAAILLAMTLAVAALLVVPILRRPEAAPERVDYDLAVFRDQLAEVARDKERGLLAPDAAAAARIEIERRILAADATRQGKGKDGAKSGRRMRLVAAMAILAGLPLGAFALYAELGSPALPGKPLAERVARQGAQIAQINAMIESLAARLEQTPDDAEGWARLATAYRMMGELPKARAAAEKLVALRPGDTGALLLLSRVQLAQAQGNDGDEAYLATLRKVRAIEPENPEALYYLGLDAARAGRVDEARGMWRRLRAVLPENSPDRERLEKLIEALGN